MLLRPLAGLGPPWLRKRQCWTSGVLSSPYTDPVDGPQATILRSPCSKRGKGHDPPLRPILPCGQILLCGQNSKQEVSCPLTPPSSLGRCAGV